MVHRLRHLDPRRYRRLLPGLALVALGVGVNGLAIPSGAQSQGPTGTAYGYFSKVSLFSGPANEVGPDPTVTLPAGGSATPVSGSAPSGSAQYGPATIFSSGPLEVSTQGETGGQVTSSASITDVNTSGDEVLTADDMASTCTATDTGITGSATITNGTLRTSEGNPDVDGDDTVVPVPTNPEPNTRISGVIEAVGDNFEYIFNEQITNPDGSITVYAAHQKLLGPTAVGDLFIGKVDCGLMASSSATTAAPTATTARATPTTAGSTATAPTMARTGFGDVGIALAGGGLVLVAGGEVVRRRGRRTGPTES